MRGTSRAPCPRKGQDQSRSKLAWSPKLETHQNGVGDGAPPEPSRLCMVRAEPKLHSHISVPCGPVPA